MSSPSGRPKTDTVGRRVAAQRDGADHAGGGAEAFARGGGYLADRNSGSARHTRHFNSQPAGTMTTIGSRLL